MAEQLPLWDGVSPPLPKRRRKTPSPPQTPSLPLGGGGDGDGRVCGSVVYQPKTTHTIDQPTTSDSHCQNPLPGTFCFSLDQAHVAQEEHVDTLAQFLYVAWRFRGVRRFLNKYGAWNVHQEAQALLLEMEDPHNESVRDPARVLTWRVRMLLADESGPIADRMLRDL